MNQIARLMLGALLAPLLLAAAEPLTAEQILAKVDAVVNAPKDQSMTMKLVLVDKGGGEKEREIVMKQKGSEKRLARFTAPADQKGIGFLSLPDGLMYIYLPAFKKTRRIAGHIKNNKFAGTDFSYEDMEARPYADGWKAAIVTQDAGTYVLRLQPMDAGSTQYGSLLVTVGADDFFPTKIRYFDRGGKEVKVMDRTDVAVIDGYLVARTSEMRDLASEHVTRMILSEVKFDSGISDDVFTERSLAQ